MDECHICGEPVDRGVVRSHQVVCDDCWLEEDAEEEVQSQIRRDMEWT